MNIKLLDSWLREYLKTSAKPEVLAEKLSLTSVSVDRIEQFNNDWIYDIEVTTNRPDLMSVIGIAREAGAVLPQFDIQAEFAQPNFPKPKTVTSIPEIDMQLKTDKVRRITAVVIDITQKESPDYIKRALEAAGIRSISNIVDITNYVMREIGHPCHVFDYDRLTTKKLTIREAKKGEKLVTLDGVEHILEGGDIVADNGEGEIVDLLGIMGTANSVVNDNTKRILFFLDNNDPHQMRRTSMGLALRSEAAVLNEKGVDPELQMDAFVRGVELYKKEANGTEVSNVLDMYPEKVKQHSVSVRFERINQAIGIDIPTQTSVNILSKLGFTVRKSNNKLEVSVPTWRIGDIEIEEDLIEEIARVYGYFRLPSKLPPFENHEPASLATNEYYWIKRVKNALKYWGFTETYTYSMVSQDLFEGPTEDAVAIANPLTDEMKYMRKELIPSLLEVVRTNKSREEVKIFELANVYDKTSALPREIQHLAGVIKKPSVSFYEGKGIIEQLARDLGIEDVTFKKGDSGIGAYIVVAGKKIGEIEQLEKNILDFELDFESLISHATLSKKFSGLAKYPPIIEDIRLKISSDVTFERIVKLIKKQSTLVKDVSLLDEYRDKKTFRIIYQDPGKNLTNEDIVPVREKIVSELKRELSAELM